MSQCPEVLECHYITKRENIVILGKHGTGKSHAATVLGVEACRRGYRVLFTTAAHLVNTLIEAREERQLKRYLAKLSRFELLIIDEAGYIPFSAEGAQLLFQVFSDRYEKACVLVTKIGVTRRRRKVMRDAIRIPPKHTMRIDSAIFN